MPWRGNSACWHRNEFDASPVSHVSHVIAGVPGYSFELWWGIRAPAGVPRETVNVLNTEINRILATAEMKAFLANEGAEPARVQEAAPLTCAGPDLGV